VLSLHSLGRNCGTKLKNLTNNQTKEREVDMIKIARLMVLVFAISGTAFAELPYKEVEALLPDIATLDGKVVSVHSVIDKIVKDGMSANTIIISLNGGLNCRISRDAFKNIKSENRKIQRRFVFKSVGNDIKIVFNGKQILLQGTDVIIRGTVKQAVNKQFILDQANIIGCRDPDARDGLNIRCGGPCISGMGLMYRQCAICQDPDSYK